MRRLSKCWMKELFTRWACLLSICRDGSLSSQTSTRTLCKTPWASHLRNALSISCSASSYRLRSLLASGHTFLLSKFNRPACRVRTIRRSWQLLWKTIGVNSSIKHWASGSCKTSAQFYWQSARKTSMFSTLLRTFLCCFTRPARLATSQLLPFASSIRSDLTLRKFLKKAVKTLTLIMRSVSQF